MRQSIVCAAFLVAPIVSVINAQTARPALPLRVGITAGFNSSTVGGKDVMDASRRPGFVAGVLLVAPFGSGLAIQPEVVFTTKGAKFNDAQGGGTFAMNYIEVPLLLRYDAAASGG